MGKGEQRAGNLEERDIPNEELAKSSCPLMDCDI